MVYVSPGYLLLRIANRFSGSLSFPTAISCAPTSSFSPVTTSPQVRMTSPRSTLSTMNMPFPPLRHLMSPIILPNGSVSTATTTRPRRNRCVANLSPNTPRATASTGGSTNPRRPRSSPDCMQTLIVSAVFLACTGKALKSRIRRNYPTC